TFSSLVEGRRLVAERTTHVEAELEREIAAGATVSVRAFRQNVGDQLVTLFGVEMPGRPATDVGHYFVANAGEVDATGWSAGLTTMFARRLHGSIEYSLTRARWNPTGDLGDMMLFAPSAIRLESARIHDVATSIESDVPQTS